MEKMLKHQEGSENFKRVTTTKQRSNKVKFPHLLMLILVLEGFPEKIGMGFVLKLENAEAEAIGTGRRGEMSTAGRIQLCLRLGFERRHSEEGMTSAYKAESERFHQEISSEDLWSPSIVQNPSKGNQICGTGHPCPVKGTEVLESSQGNINRFDEICEMLQTLQLHSLSKTLKAGHISSLISLLIEPDSGSDLESNVTLEALFQVTCDLEHWVLGNEVKKKKENMGKEPKECNPGL
ncbi:hypothetical protein E5288_WYG013173 [Bos mutus]|uniref:Uncharacterized protein n=1 Tax=Bos mutus TaxID=72004 RepID=A0A6B0RYX3_9CETA|nr:hypothetical protein [Bos mutus]